MSDQGFVHLHVHNEYSYLDGLGSAKEFVSRAKELGMPSLGLTNHGNIDGLIKFQKECDKQGISPILGCEIYIVPDMTIKQKGDKKGHMTILVKNLTGWIELCRILTIANLEGFYSRPRIDYETLLNADLSGWIILSGCANSFLRLRGAGDVMKELIDRMGDRLYLEIMPHDSDYIKEYHYWLIEEWLDTGLPLIATNDCHYPMRGDWKSQEVLLAIQRKKVWSDEDRFRFTIKGLHLRNRIEMVRAFEKQGIFVKKGQVKNALKNTIVIAEQCADFRIPKQEMSLPSPPSIVTDDYDHFIRRVCQPNIDKYWPKESKAQEIYIKRFNEEADLIKQKGFAKYFLIVWDLIRWVRNKGWMVGPGRGSVGGSLIANMMGITAPFVDPIYHDLLFSRFISEDRIDWPDIDIDFEKMRRDEIRAHVINTYGRNSVCGISTAMSMNARGVVRDVARIFEIPFPEANEFAKGIYQKDTKVKILDEVFSGTDGKRFKSKYPDEADLMLKLEGQIRGAGQHAAAVIISDQDLTTGTKCVLVKRSGKIVCNWDMSDAEYVGLIKFDFLGLATLSVLNEAMRLIHNIPLERFHYDDIPMDDRNVFRMLSDGNTAGIFQLSAWVSTELCKEMGIQSFDDIAVILAIVRPGPADSGMTEEYLARRKGKRWTKKHPIYERITKETFGMIIYQEQIMQVISQVAGLSESDADKIRKIIGKKRDAKEFLPFKEKIIQGCKEQDTLSVKEVEEFWDTLQEHAKYSFNKSHSIQYATIAYQTAFIKHYYPAEFICATLSYGEFDEKSKDKAKWRQSIINLALEKGFQIFTPKVDISDGTRWLTKDDRLYAPFAEISGIGPKQADELAKSQTARNKGFFDDPALTRPADRNTAVLSAIYAFDKDKIPEQEIIKEHFDFNVENNPQIQYYNLVKILGHSISESDADKWKSLDISQTTAPKGLIRRARAGHGNLINCCKCGLISEGNRPVRPSPGMYNVIISGEAPGPDEDKYGRGFYEDAVAGKLLWDELAFHGLSRQLFHVTNICKCYPKKTRPPKQEHIDACWPWFIEELIQLDCRLILGIGNTSLLAFTGRKGGITDLSGTTEWIEKLEAWVCWCLHPAAVARKGSNRKYFEKGIENFSKKFELLC